MRLAPRLSSSCWLALAATLALSSAPGCGDDDDDDVVAADAASPDAAALPDAASPDAALPDAGEPDGPVALCAEALPCPTPNPGKVSMCGHLIDVVSELRIGADGESALATCDPDAPSDDGACALTVQFFDPLAFAADSAGTVPLPVDNLVIDTCGRFTATNITLPFNGFVAVVVDAAGTADDFATTGAAFSMASGETRVDVPAFATARTADARWTTTAGDPFGGTTFVERGVLLTRFRHGLAPVPGARITAGGVISAAGDFYLATGPSGLNDQVDPALTATSASGTSLLVDSTLQNHSGRGAEPAGCSWESELAVAIPGVVFVQTLDLVNDIGDPCPVSAR